MSASISDLIEGIVSNQIKVFSNASRWEGKGKFTPHMLDFSDFDRWINMATLEFRNVVSRYEASVEDDNRIDIMEKNLLIKELDQFMNCLIAFRFHLNEPIETFTAQNQKYGFGFSMKKDDEGWSGEGAFGKQYGVKAENFQIWYEKNMLKKFNEFGSFYRKATADKIIDNTEKKKFCEILDLFIFEILIVRYYLYKRIYES